MEQLQSFFTQPASSYNDLETGKVWASVFLPDKPKNFEASLREQLLRIRKCGLKIGTGRIRLQQLRRENWANAWKRHFKPLWIGSRLLIKPSWSRRHPLKNMAVVILDPGLSFGTGQHPTTAFCLQHLVRARNGDSRQSLLDIGTGSGILAIAAAKLGYQRVDAFDFDPEAVRVARSNARRNRAGHQIRFQQADLTQLPKRSVRKYDVVCANLISTLLTQEYARIIDRLKPGGHLLLAGILKTEFQQVRHVFEAQGLKLMQSRTAKEWRSGAFCLRGTSEDNRT